MATGSIMIPRRSASPGQATERTRPPGRLNLLSVKGAADYAKVSTQTIRRWARSGDLKIYRAGRQLRIDESDLVRLLSL